MLFQGRRGIGILEVSIALVISGIVSLGLIQLLNNMNRAQRSTELANDFIALHNSILGVLNSERSCASALNYLYLKPAGPTSVPNIKIGSTVVAEINTVTHGLRTTSLSLENPTNLGTRVSGGITQKQYSAVFRIVADKLDAKGRSAVGVQGYNKTFSIGVYTNPALTDGTGGEKIVECFGQFSDAKACEDLGGTYQVYDDGQSPRCGLTKLSVADTAAQRTAQLDTAGYPFSVINSSPRPGNSPGAAFFADFGTTLADKSTYIWLRSLYDDATLATHTHPQWGLQANPFSDTFSMHQAGFGNLLTVTPNTGFVGIGLNNSNPAGELHIRSSIANRNAHIYLEPLTGAQKTLWRMVSVGIDGRLEFCMPTQCPFRIYRDAPEHVLDLTGTGIESVYGHIAGPSDIRLKKDVTPLESSLNKILTLRSVKYRWKKENDEAPLKPGFIAQEVEKVIPVAVHTQDNADKTKSVEPTYLTPYLVKAFQEQNEIITKLKTDLEREKNERLLLSERLRRLETK